MLPPRRCWLLFALAAALPARAARAQDPPLITFDRYHTVQEFDAFLRAAHARYPKLTELIQIGESRGGRPIFALEINNPDTGPAAGKPAFYNDGNIHGGELSGGEAALYFINHLLTQYGRDDRITRLVDLHAFYHVPLVNPDGRWVSMTTPKNNRWNLRPVDEDGDGRVDEDGFDDLDGDGLILRMRVADPEGAWTISPDDPRLMVRAGRGRRGGGRGARRGAGRGAPADAGPRYTLLEEGIDNDGDGAINEDPPGGIDLNRNFPSNWSPAQFASGPFPLSEPESYALTAYIVSRPNIAAIHTYHTSGGMILRFPTLADQDWDYPAADLAAYRAIGDDGVAETGYTHFATSKQAIIDRMNPGHGVFNDWASNVFGVLAITTEMWRRGPGQDEAARMRWNDEERGGEEFIDWHEFEHPTLGRVEIGGWKRWIAGSPPEPLLAPELQRNNNWLLTFAEKMPRLEILDVKIESGIAPGTFKLTATVANTGWMNTATEHAKTVLGIAQRISISIEGENIVSEDSFSVAELSGTMGGGRNYPETFEFAIRTREAAGPRAVTLVVRSQKAGTARRTVQLPPG